MLRRLIPTTATAVLTVAGWLGSGAVADAWFWSSAPKGHKAARLANVDCFGFHPTCWGRWPDHCRPCPPPPPPSPAVILPAKPLGQAAPGESATGSGAAEGTKPEPARTQPKPMLPANPMKDVPLAIPGKPQDPMP
jgi:hypothetical protein